MHHANIFNHYTDIKFKLVILYIELTDHLQTF